ncbi:hypothetical protein [Streptomyces malaysiensis]|uniref:hypothetical protein n=1 Tax=Streptomyces malaysiensis TaxID=92644 RepID=UPI00368A3E05
MLARISDALELSNHLFIKANSSEANDLPLPVALPRPGQPQEPEEPQVPESHFASGEELSNFFAQMNNL